MDKKKIFFGVVKVIGAIIMFIVVHVIIGLIAAVLGHNPKGNTRS